MSDSSSGVLRGSRAPLGCFVADPESSDPALQVLNKQTAAQAASGEDDDEDDEDKKKKAEAEDDKKKKKKDEGDKSEADKKTDDAKKVKEWFSGDGSDEKGH